MSEVCMTPLVRAVRSVGFRPLKTVTHTRGNVISYLYSVIRSQKPSDRQGVIIHRY